MKPIAILLFLAAVSPIVRAQTNDNPAHRLNDAPALYELGRDAIRRGEPEKAAEHFEKAVSLKPSDANYHYQLAGAYGQAAANAGMFGAMSLAKKVKAELLRSIALDPNALPPRFLLMEFYLAAPAIAGGSESGALEQAAEIRKRDSLDGHRAYARIHAAAKKPELARREYTDLLKEQPRSARAHYLFGVHLMLMEKNYAAAGEELESAVKLDPSYMPAYFRIGHLAALAEGNFGRGEEALRKYLGYAPKDDEPPVARAHYWLGAIFEKQQKRMEARSSYAESLRINPNQKDAAAAMKRVS